MFITQEKYLLNKFYKTTTLQTLYFLAVYMYLSFLSPYLSSIGWDEVAKGWFFSSFALVGILVSPFLGSLADTFGRFRLIIGGFFLEIACIIGYAHLTSVAGLMFIRLLAAIAFNAVIIGGLSRINDIVTDVNRSTVTGFFESAKSIGILIAPLLGGLIADRYGFVVLFEVSLGFMIALLFGLFIFDKFFYDDHHPHRTRPRFKPKDINPLQAIPTMMKHQELRLITIIGIIANITAPFTVSVLPYIITIKMGLSNVHLSLAIMLIGGGYIFQYLLGKLADRIGKGKGIAYGLLVGGLGFVAMFFAINYIFLLGCIIVFSFGRSLFNTSALAYMSDIGERYNIEGKVIGSYSSLSKIAMAISFAVTGFLLVEVNAGIFLLYALCLLIASSFAFALPKQHIVFAEEK